MAKYVNSNKARGYFNTMKMDRNKSRHSILGSAFLQEFSLKLQDFSKEKNSNRYSLNDLNTSLGEEHSNEKRFWMDLINPIKEHMDCFDILYSRLKKIDCMCAIISCFLIIITQIEYETEYYPSFYLIQDEKISNYQGLPWRILYSILSVALIICDYYSAYVSFVIKTKQKAIETEVFIKTSYFIRFLIDILIDGIHPFPRIELQFSLNLLGQNIEYQIQTFFYALQFLKIRHLYRLLAVFSPFTKQYITNSSSISHGNFFNTIFALKCAQKETPFLLLSINLISVALVLGIILRMFEILNKQGGGDKDFLSFTNGIWCIVVAITTVGYGDFYPTTHFGRTIVIFAVFLGTFLISLTINALQKGTSFNKTELLAFSILNKVPMKLELKKMRIKFIQVTARIYNMITKYHDFDTLFEMKEFTCLLRYKNFIGEKIFHLQKLIMKDYLVTEEDKFLDLEPIIDENIISIHDNLNQVIRYNLSFSSQINNQISLIKKLDSTINSTQKSLRPLLIQLLLKKSGNGKWKLTDDGGELQSQKKIPTTGEQHNLLKDYFESVAAYTSPAQVCGKSEGELNFEKEIDFTEIDTEKSDRFEFKDSYVRDLVMQRAGKTLVLLQELERIREKNNQVLKKSKMETDEGKEDDCDKKEPKRIFFEESVIGMPQEEKIYRVPKPCMTFNDLCEHIASLDN